MVAPPTPFVGLGRAHRAKYTKLAPLPASVVYRPAGLMRFRGGGPEWEPADYGSGQWERPPGRMGLAVPAPLG